MIHMYVNRIEFVLYNLFRFAYLPTSLTSMTPLDVVGIEDTSVGRHGNGIGANG